MPEGGQLTLTAENTVIRPQSDGQIPAGAKAPVFYVVITVQGQRQPAFPREILDKIFEPIFFTTKKMGKGDGALDWRRCWGL